MTKYVTLRWHSCSVVETPSKIIFTRKKLKKKYVQHIIENEIASFVVEKIVEQNGHFYVCGDVKMANGVCDALKNVLITHGKMNKLEAD